MANDYLCNNMNIIELAKHIEKLTGLDCYNDEIETDEFNFGDFGELGITIEENNRISIFRSFGYYDFPQDEQDIKSQECDDLSYAQESAFYFFLKVIRISLQYLGGMMEDICALDMLLV